MREYLRVEILVCLSARGKRRRCCRPASARNCSAGEKKPPSCMPGSSKPIPIPSLQKKGHAAGCTRSKSRRATPDHRRDETRPIANSPTQRYSKHTHASKDASAMTSFSATAFRLAALPAQPPVADRAVSRVPRIQLPHRPPLPALAIALVRHLHALASGRDLRPNVRFLDRPGSCPRRGLAAPACRTARPARAAEESASPATRSKAPTQA